MPDTGRATVPSARPPRGVVAAAAAAYGAVVAGDVIFLRGALHAAAALLAVAVAAAPWMASAGVFAVLALLGESFRVPGLGKLSVLHLALLYALARHATARDLAPVARALAAMRANLPLVAFLAVGALYTVLGVARGNAMGDVSETIQPFVYVAIAYAVTAALGPRHLRALLVVLLVASIAGAAKAFYVSFVPVDALWDNAWQAGRTPIPGSPVARVILRGGDVMLVVSLLLASSLLLFGALRRRGVLALGAVGMPVLVLANFVSMTRSNYAGIAVGLLLLAGLTQWPRRGSVSPRTALALVAFLGFAAVLFAVFDSYFNLVETFLARTGGDNDNAGATLDWRAAENEQILQAIRDRWYLGGGAGTRFSFPENPDGLGESIYSHSAVLWLLQHYGLPGLLTFLWLGLRVARGCVAGLRRALPAEDRAVLAWTAAAWAGMFVLSLAVNKVASISGALVWGMLAATADAYGRLRAGDAGEPAR